MSLVRPALAIAFALALVAPAVLEAHPLGNFSINHYTGLRVDAERVEITYVIDMAEIPTFQEIQAHGLVPDPEDPSVLAYLRRATEGLREGLHLEINGSRRSLQTASSGVLFPPGAGDLPTLRLRAVYRVDLDMATARPFGELRYRDENFPHRAGWKEIVAVAGAKASLTASSVPEQDRSRALSDYPEDLLASPPQDLEARVVFAVVGATGGAAVSAAPPRVPRPRDSPERGRIDEKAELPVLASAMAPAVPRLAFAPRSTFMQLVTPRELSFGVILLAVVTALGVGAAHALEPGHGKTIVAAYLVGARGTAWHAVVLGFVVTAAHTAGVFLLGFVTLYASRYVVPERLYPWLGMASGLTIAGLGFWLFLQRFAENGGHHHGHDHHAPHGPGHGHEHSHSRGHHGDDHQHGHRHGHHHHDAPATLRQLFTLGVTGGIVPCPAALVVLLSAIALRRTGLGLVLIVAFSVGLASVLVGIGLLMVYARRFMSRIQGDGRLVRRWLPLAAAAVITVLGVTIAVQALMAGGIIQIKV